jgi:hypothetical protein
MKTIHRNDTTHTSRSRDAALRRLARTKRWLAAGAVALTGALTEVAASAFPGRTVHRPATRGAGASHSRHRPLKPPAEPPKPATTQSERTPAPETDAGESTASQPGPAQTPSSEGTVGEAPAPSEPAPAETQPAEAHEPPPAEEPVVSSPS